MECGVGGARSEWSMERMEHGASGAWSEWSVERVEYSGESRYCNSMLRFLDLSVQFGHLFEDDMR